MRSGAVWSGRFLSPRRSATTSILIHSFRSPASRAASAPSRSRSSPSSRRRPSLPSSTACSLPPPPPSRPTSSSAPTFAPSPRCGMPARPCRRPLPRRGALPSPPRLGDPRDALRALLVRVFPRAPPP